MNAVNIVHAKYIVNSIPLSDYSDFYKEKVIKQWGYEFFPEEDSYPFIFGGWESESIFGCDLSLLNLDLRDPKIF